MAKKIKLLLLVLLPLGIILSIAIFLLTNDVAVLNPKGYIADKQFELIMFTLLLSLIIIIPVFTLTFFIAWRYRASNAKAKYSPDWDHSRIAESIWWLIPLALITVLAVITWKTTHELDPYKPISSEAKPITIQVVALEWKWLFIYPEHGIATVNYFQFPEKTPVKFEITGDAPMNSFWIPQLGGQVYAMAGMKTKLHIMANEVGKHYGSSANISGEGFAGMKFIAESTDEADFKTWVKKTQQSPTKLTMDAYKKLAIPSKDNPVTYYATPERDLYDTVIMKYMTPGQRTDTKHKNERGH